MTKFLLDSGDPEEYREVAALAKAHGQELWGSTTNPSLIAKKLAGEKLSPQDAFTLQKELVLQIVEIVSGAVSAEVYADLTTSFENMVEQGREIASWHPRVVVKLPTTLAGMKAREILRKEGITINNTLVFSQQQVFTIATQENFLQQQYGPTKSGFPCFISPFVGRLDDKNENGLEFVAEALAITHQHFSKDLVWMLEASVRNVYHLKAAIQYGAELVTAPKEVYVDWFGLTKQEQDEIDIQDHLNHLQDIPVWQPTHKLLAIKNLNELSEALTTGALDITDPLTTAGITKFVADWKTILE